jgi:hypothetical protein
MDELGRRRFLKGAAAAGAAVTWAAPTIARAATIGPVGTEAPGAAPPCDAAGVLFSDDFQGETAQATTTNYATWNKWDVTDGTVDLIGPEYSGTTLAVDLDGSTANSGLFSLKPAFQPTQTTGKLYTLTFAYRGNGNTASVAFGEAPAELVTSPSDGWLSKSISYVATSTGPIALSFQDQGNDNGGVYLDDVVITESCPDIE